MLIINRFYLLILSFFMVFSFSANALTNGILLNTELNPDLVQVNGWHGFCTGTVVASKFIITAAHCRDGADILTGVHDYKVIKTTIEPRFKTDESDAYDIAIQEIAQPIEKSRYVSPEAMIKGDNYTLVGGAHGTLHSGIFKGSKPWNAADPDDYMLNNLKSITEGGDSGGGVFNKAGDLVGKIEGGDDKIAMITTLKQSSAWILKTINSLNYPTVVKSAKDNIQTPVTVKVQNLQEFPTVVIANTSGSVVIQSQTCGDANVINPYDTCTITVTGRGKLHFESNSNAVDTIDVNPKAVTPVKPVAPSSGGGGGGSFSWLLLLLPFALGRRFIKK